MNPTTMIAHLVRLQSLRYGAAACAAGDLIRTMLRIARRRVLWGCR